MTAPFADKLKALRERATPGWWRVLADFEEKPAGLQFSKDGGVFLHRDMPNRAGNVELIAYLVNHAADIERLVRAAEKICIVGDLRHLENAIVEVRGAVAELNKVQS